MKKYMAFAVLVLFAAVSQADLVITEIMSSSVHTNTAGNGDWWELYNSGAAAIDLTNYSWDDNTATPGSANFNGLTISAGQALVICQETIGQEDVWRAIWGIPLTVALINLGNTEFQNFSSSGDAVNLYDPSSALIASVTFGTATTGYSFEWDSAGNYLDLSVIGENGAFQATEIGGDLRDVGSPGAVSVIPEPATLALMGAGALILMMRRRLRQA